MLFFFFQIKRNKDLNIDFIRKINEKSFVDYEIFPKIMGYTYEKNEALPNECLKKKKKCGIIVAILSEIKIYCRYGLLHSYHL